MRVGSIAVKELDPHGACLHNAAIQSREMAVFIVDETPMQSAWFARLDLQYSYSPVDTRTGLTRRSHAGPLVVQKLLYPEGPEVCHTLILHPPGGIAGGDNLDIGIALNAGARVLISMPGASKWYRSREAAAVQRMRVNVAAGAVLEWLPPETIVFKDAAARMHTSIDLAAGGAYVGWEILCLGRTASGEKFDSGSVHQTIELSVAGELLWSERCRLAGGSPLLESAAGLGGAPVSALMLAAGKSIAPELVAQCRAITLDGAARSGITAMPDIFAARYVGHSSEQAKCFFVGLWRLLRPLFSGRSAVLPRIWST